MCLSSCMCMHYHVYKPSHFGLSILSDTFLDSCTSPVPPSLSLHTLVSPRLRRKRKLFITAASTGRTYESSDYTHLLLPRIASSTPLLTLASQNTCRAAHSLWPCQQETASGLRTFFVPTSL